MEQSGNSFSDMNFGLRLHSRFVFLSTRSPKTPCKNHAHDGSGFAHALQPKKLIRHRLPAGSSFAGCSTRCHSRHIAPLGLEAVYCPPATSIGPSTLVQSIFRRACLSRQSCREQSNLPQLDRDVEGTRAVRTLHLQFHFPAAKGSRPEYCVGCPIACHDSDAVIAFEPRDGGRCDPNRSGRRRRHRRVPGAH